MALDGKKFKEELSKRIVALLDSERGMQSRLAKTIGKNGSYFSELKRGKPVNTLHLKAVGIVFGPEKVLELMSLDINLAKNGSGRHFETENTDESSIQSKFLDNEHTKLVKQFSNKKLANEIDQHLLEIERLNEAAFKETCAYIKGITAGLKSMVEYDRRKCDRRKHKDGNWPPDQERRSADRRKAVGQ
jgi:hypothetical protein